MDGLQTRDNRLDSRSVGDKMGDIWMRIRGWVWMLCVSIW